MSRLLNRIRAGLDPRPWPAGAMPTGDTARVREVVGAAARSRALLSLTGPRGSGKSVALRAALEAAGARVVEPLRLDRERLRMGDIAVAVIRELSGEAPRASAEARARQVRRLLGAASPPATLVLDDAHRLHWATLAGVKRLMELAWGGRSPLLAVVLVGHRDRAASVPEVGLRADAVSMLGLSEGEAARALEAALRPRGGECLAGPEEIRRLAASPRARLWLDLLALADEALAAALAGPDAPRIDAGAVDRALKPAADAGRAAPPKRPAGADPGIQAVAARRPARRGAA